MWPATLLAGRKLLFMLVLNYKTVSRKNYTRPKLKQIWLSITELVFHTTMHLIGFKHKYTCLYTAGTSVKRVCAHILFSFPSVTSCFILLRKYIIQNWTDVQELALSTACKQQLFSITASLSAR